jgi:PrcB C-terminal
MRTDFRILVAYWFSFVIHISACTLQDGPPLEMDQEKTKQGKSQLSIATVEKGDRSGIRGPLQTVIRNQDEWKALWKRHSSTDTSPSPAPSIDFDREMIVGIFLGEKSTGGYEVEIVRAEQRDSSLYFYYREKSPAAGAMVTQALTQPFHLVRVAKYDNLQVIFRRDS